MVCTVEELNNERRDKIVIDIRSSSDFIKDTYPGAVNVYWEEFDEKAAGVIDRQRPVYLICYNGRHSDEIAERYSADGYEMYSVEGGYGSYLKYMMKELLGSEDETLSQRREAERSLIKTFRRQLWTPFVRAVNEYELIKDGDRIAVCISGGKDSMMMAKLFQELYEHGRRNFEPLYLAMNPGYNDINHQMVLDNAKLLGIPLNEFNSEIFDIVAGEGESPCYLCARMRRGALYSKARELGCNKIALGHHYDDVIETILMGMLYGGQVQTMMPKLHSQNFPGMELIRPLYLIREDDIRHWASHNHLHFIQCACRFTENCASCGGAGKGSKRAEIKKLIKTLHDTNQYTEANIFKSVENVNLSTVIAYKKDGITHNFLDTYDGKGENYDDR